MLYPSDYLASDNGAPGSDLPTPPEVPTPGRPPFEGPAETPFGTPGKPFKPDVPLELPEEPERDAPLESPEREGIPENDDLPGREERR